MGIIDIPGERFNLAGKEATFSLSYLCVILEMTIATSRGGGRGTWGGSAAGERCSRTPVDGGAWGEPPPLCLAPACPRWALGQPAHPTMAADRFCIAETPGPSHSAASQPHPWPGIPEQQVAGALVAAAPTEGAFPSLALLQHRFLPWASGTLAGVLRAHTGGS